MSVDRHVLAGGAAFVAFVGVVHGLARVVPAESAATLVGLTTPLLQAAALVLTCLAFIRNRTSRYRWTWALLGLWLVANLFADTAWGLYELWLKTPPPTPSPADIGSLISYPLAFLTVLYAAWKAAGRLRAAEGALDALMFTVGAAGLAWPLLVAPLVQSSEPGMQHVINFAYPMGDILVIMAFASLLLGAFHERPPRFLVVIWVAFLFQVVADSLYFIGVAQTGTYHSGGPLDSLWALVFALAGVAALMGVFPGEAQGEVAESETGVVHPARLLPASMPSNTRMLMPYLALPLVGAMIWMQFAWYGSRWDGESKALLYLGVVLVALLVVRQFLTLVDNRRLSSGLSDLSQELGERVGVLADLTGRLQELNSRADRLNSLRALPEVMRGGLELACSVTKSPAAWITLTPEDGTQFVAASFGPAEAVPSVGSRGVYPGRTVREVRLDARGDRIGSLWLVRPATDDQGPDLVQTVAAQLATAIDNASRYEEALRLAERDPLTELLNHGGIHDRLAVEERRARQHGGCLSLVMIDLDDFKLLNDTYGHPAGDQVLARVSETIKGMLRHNDQAGRVGGDEMMLVLPDTDREGAFHLAERLREKLSHEPFMAGTSQAIPLRLSFGVATYPTDADSLPSLIGAADASLYTSKLRGGDTISDASTETEPQAEGHGLQALASRLMDVVGARDHYTRRHSDQVVVHALSLGETLGLSEDSLETLRLAAMLHDVGKIGVRARLLRKPAPPTDEEENAVRRHVDISETIIRDLPRVAEVLAVVHVHHERHDGEGYPVGLAGEDIPLLARILAIADAYSAMVVDRPYRRKLTGEQAKIELLKVAGTQLDPELVQRFVDTLADKPDSAYAATG